MPTASETSDSQLLELLRRSGAQGVTEIAEATEVTATAVRQRLTRLMAQGLIERTTVRSGRGRPSHQYSLTDKARRQAGSNFGDLALVLWNEIRNVKDVEIRRGLLQRLATSMAAMYRERMTGHELHERLDSLRDLFADRGVLMEVDMQGDGENSEPVLRVLDCPYPELAEQDRGICALEKMLFADLLGEDVRLAQCRLEGHDCCQFQTS